MLFEEMEHYKRCRQIAWGNGVPPIDDYEIIAGAPLSPCDKVFFSFKKSLYSPTDVKKKVALFFPFLFLGYAIFLLISVLLVWKYIYIFLTVFGGNFV